MSLSRSIFDGDNFERTYQNYKKSTNKYRYPKESPTKPFKGYISTFMKSKESYEPSKLHHTNSFNSNKNKVLDFANKFGQQPTISLSNNPIWDDFGGKRSSKYSSKPTYIGHNKSRSRSQKKYQQIFDELSNSPLSRRNYAPTDNDLYGNYGKKKSLLTSSNNEGKSLFSDFKSGLPSRQRQLYGGESDPLREDVRKLQMHVSRMSDREFAELPYGYREDLVRLAQSILAHNKRG